MTSTFASKGQLTCINLEVNLITYGKDHSKNIRNAG